MKCAGTATGVDGAGTGSGASSRSAMRSADPRSRCNASMLLGRVPTISNSASGSSATTVSHTASIRPSWTAGIVSARAATTALPCSATVTPPPRPRAAADRRVSVVTRSSICAITCVAAGARSKATRSGTASRDATTAEVSSAFAGAIRRSARAASRPTSHGAMTTPMIATTPIATPAPGTSHAQNATVNAATTPAWIHGRTTRSGRSSAASTSATSRLSMSPRAKRARPTGASRTIRSNTVTRSEVSPRKAAS